MPIDYCNQHARLFNQHKSLWMDFGREKMRRAEAVYNYVGTAAFKIVERLAVISAQPWSGRLCMSKSNRHSRKLPSTHTEARMRKKCATCGILLDVPCPKPTCDGHHNESRGDACVYCATNERDNMRYQREISNLFRSSLGDIGHGED